MKRKSKQKENVFGTAFGNKIRISVARMEHRLVGKARQQNHGEGLLKTNRIKLYALILPQALMGQNEIPLEKTK